MYSAGADERAGARAMHHDQKSDRCCTRPIAFQLGFIQNVPNGKFPSTIEGDATCHPQDSLCTEARRMQRCSQSRGQQCNSSGKQPSARLTSRCRSAGISTVAPANVMAPASDYKIRTYEHSTDRQHVVDICADVCE